MESGAATETLRSANCQCRGPSLRWLGPQVAARAEPGL